ncbi:hypothetical protein O5345_19590 [Escherichia coli]|nr:hypothetical protein [Escherichia coli]
MTNQQQIEFILEQILKNARKEPARHDGTMETAAGRMAQAYFW